MPSKLLATPRPRGCTGSRLPFAAGAAEEERPCIALQQRRWVWTSCQASETREAPMCTVCSGGGGGASGGDSGQAAKPVREQGTALGASLSRSSRRLAERFGKPATSRPPASDQTAPSQRPVSGSRRPDGPGSGSRRLALVGARRSKSGNTRAAAALSIAGAAASHGGAPVHR